MGSDSVPRLGYSLWLRGYRIMVNFKLFLKIHTKLSKLFFSRYCDILQKCKEAAVKGKKYANDPEIRKILDEPTRLCPPPKGEWTITFNHAIKLEDLPEGFFGPLQSVSAKFSPSLDRFADRFDF